MVLRRIVFCMALAVVPATLPGCSDSNLGQVSGRITFDGKPLENAMVTFTPVAGGRPASARTDSTGQYELVYSRDAAGAMLGQHTVTISSFAEDVAEDGTVKVTPEKIPVEYNLGTTLKADVQGGSNEFNFDLKSGGRVVQPDL